MMDEPLFGTFSHSRAFAMSTVPILIAEDDRRNIVIDRPAIVVGRSRRRSDVRINDRSISAVHCEIEIRENCLQVRNRGRNGIRINGQKSDEGVLHDGDVFEIARMKYRVLIKGDPNLPNASELSSSNDWFARLAGLELGPMPWAELSLMAQRGELTESDEVRWSRQRIWRPASATDGLFDAEPHAESNENPEAPASHPVTSDQPVEDSAAERETPPSDEDDQSWTVEFASLDDSEESSIHDRDSTRDTATDFLDETATSANTFQLAEPPLNDSHETNGESEVIDDEVVDEPGGDNDEWRLADTPAEPDAPFEFPEASFPTQTESSLPTLPVPQPMTVPQPLPVPQRESASQTVSALQTAPVPPPVNVTPQPAPYKPAPMPKIGQSDTWLDVIYDSVLEPVFDRVPLLRTWPGIATIVAALVIAALMMRPSYEGSEVSGRVTLNGQPVTDATISFTDVKNGFGASAVVDADGNFEVVTLKGGMQPGTYSVAIMPLKPESPEVVGELQRQFSKSKNGILDEAVMMGEGEPGFQPGGSSSESGEETFKLPATTIPFNYRSIQTSGISKEITEDGPNELVIDLVSD